MALTRRLADTGSAGTILATEIVRLLLPHPDCGQWSDEFAGDAGPASMAIHQLFWRTGGTAGGITVVVAEDAAIIRAGIVSLLRADGMTSSARPAITTSCWPPSARSRPRLLITDIRMPPGQADEGLRAAGMLRAEQPRLSVLVLSQHVQASAAADLLTGQTSGIGYLLKERVTALDEFLIRGKDCRRRRHRHRSADHPGIAVPARHGAISSRHWPTGKEMCWN